MQDRGIHKGSCLCGRVTFELKARLNGAVGCKCSTCRSFAPLWQSASDATMRIVAGIEQISTYSFGDTIAMDLYFCRHCGVRLFMRRQSDPSHSAVNLNCLDDVDASMLKRQFSDDGRQCCVALELRPEF